jgi:predicted TIM-barrel fold metal-dependent hydrolase
MAADGVVADVLYPTRGKSVFRVDYEPEISEAAARVYNDWLIEFCQEAPDRLWGQALLPLWDIENAIVEMDRCKKAGLVGATTWLVPPDGLRFTSEHYDRFWAAAQDMEMPVSMHINNGFGPYAEAAEAVRVRNRGDRLTELSFTATGHKKLAADTLTDIICSGVLERYPRLKIVVAETEVGWIPFWLEELDKRLRRRESLPLLPSEYFYRQCHATFSDDPVGGHLLSHWGADSFLWANDYPHPGTGDTWLYSGAIIARDLGHLSQEIRGKVVRDTVASLYGKPIPSAMPMPTGSDPSMDEWRAERLGYYVGIT